MQGRGETRPSYFTSSILEPYTLVNFVVWVIVVIVGLFFVWFMFFHAPEFGPSDFMKYENSKLTARLVVPFLTSDATSWRNTYYVAKFVEDSSLWNSTVYAYVISDSEAAVGTAANGIVTPHCTGGRLDANGNACRFDVAFRHFHRETDAPWLLVAIDDTYLNARNVMRLLALLETRYDPLRDQVSLGQRHHDWGTSYPHGGPGLLFSRAWVDEFFRLNMSFEKIHAHNVRYTYDIATGLLTLNYFNDSVWIDHPWLCVVAPEDESFDVLIKQNWADLPACPARLPWNGVFVKLRDIAQFHISPFKQETAGYVKNLENAPEQVKLFRPTTYGIRFCWQESEENVQIYESAQLDLFIVNKTAVNKRDLDKRIQANATKLF